MVSPYCFPSCALLITTDNRIVLLQTALAHSLAIFHLLCYADVGHWLWYLATFLYLRLRGRPSTSRDWIIAECDRFRAGTASKFGKCLDNFQRSQSIFLIGIQVAVIIALGMPAYLSATSWQLIYNNRRLVYLLAQLGTVPVLLVLLLLLHFGEYKSVTGTLSVLCICTSLASWAMAKSKTTPSPISDLHEAIVTVSAMPAECGGIDPRIYCWESPGVSVGLFDPSGRFDIATNVTCALILLLLGSPVFMSSKARNFLNNAFQADRWPHPRFWCEAWSQFCILLGMLLLIDQASLMKAYLALPASRSLVLLPYPVSASVPLGQIISIVVWGPVIIDCYSRLTYRKSCDPHGDMLLLHKTLIAWPVL